MRRVHFKKIKKYFIDKGENEKAFTASLIRVYNLLHILVVGDIAVNILRDRVTKGIKSHNSGHSTTHLADYVVALNYYNNKELELFNKTLNGLLEDVSIAIDENIHLTPARISNDFSKALLTKIETRRNFFTGDSFRGKGRGSVNELIIKYVAGDISTEVFDEGFNNLRIGNTFTL